MPKKKTAKKKVKPLTWDDVSKWPLLQNPVRVLLDREGAVTPSYAIEKLKEGLEAFETKPFKGTIKEFEGGDLTRIIDKVIYSKPLIAHAIRQKAREDLFRYLGMEPAEKTEPLTGDITLRVVYGNKSPKKKNNGTHN